MRTGSPPATDRAPVVPGLVHPVAWRAVQRRMSARTVAEPHRTATPLELLFDLTFVAAVAQLAGRFSHAVVASQTMSATGPFLMVFFAIWWAWMNFTWFASAYDCDDVAYRLATFVQMGGVLVLAAGIGPAFDHGDYAAVSVGYLVMRLGLISLWVRASVQHPAGRPTALRYAGGMAALQLLWLARLALGDRAITATFLALAVLELVVPLWAERRGATSWHPHHIGERYALFTIILLGESVFAATTAVAAVVEDVAGPQLVFVSAASLVIVAGLWWLYFAVPAGVGLERHRRWSFVWGYGHYFFFAAVAALGAGFEVLVGAGAGEAPGLAAGAALAAVVLPVAAVMVMLDLLQVPPPGSLPRVRLGTAVALVALGALLLAPGRVGVAGGVGVVAVVVVGAVLADVVSSDRPAPEEHRVEVHP
jgi:low temperature requirement protein LtrA